MTPSFLVHERIEAMIPSLVMFFLWLTFLLPWEFHSRVNAEWAEMKKPPRGWQWILPWLIAEC
jgi:hypothetical protein